MEITPSDQDMLIEAKVMPNNIESVLASKLKNENHVNVEGLSDLIEPLEEILSESSELALPPFWLVLSFAQILSRAQNSR